MNRGSVKVADTILKQSVEHDRLKEKHTRLKEAHARLQGENETLRKEKHNMEVNYHDKANELAMAQMEIQQMKDKVMCYKDLNQAKRSDCIDLEEQLSIAKQAMEHLEGYVSVVRRMR